jgi:hypothetical protein
MRSQVNNRRSVLLSEYLDGRLPPEAVQQVDALLAADAAAVLELSALREARQLLRLAPRRKAARNFALNPTIARSIRRDRLAIPLLGSSGLASAGLALALFLFSYLPIGYHVVPPAAATFAFEAAPAASGAAPYTLNGEPVIITWGSPPAAGGRGGGGGDGSSAPAVLTDTYSLKSPVMESPAAPTAPPAPDLSQATYPPITGSGPILGIMPTEPGVTTAQPAVSPQLIVILGKFLLFLAGATLIFISCRLTRKRYR